MARENFLINPIRKGKVRSKRKGLPSALLSRMIREHGRSGMKKAWAAYRTGVRKNPFGEEVIVVGANPRRRRKRLVRDNVWFGHRAGHAAAARKGWRHHRGISMNELADNPRRRRRYRRRRNAWTGDTAGHAAAAIKGWRRRRSYRLNENPRRYRRYARRFRRNPAARDAAISIMRPMTLIMPIATGIVANMAVTKIPTMLNVTTELPKRAIQIGIMAAGNLVLRGVIGRTNAMIWTVVSGVTIATELLNKYVFKTALSYVEGIPMLGMGAYPQELSADTSRYSGEYGMGAYPYEGVVQY